ncbi:hypothetical protein LWI28_000116 [Acer negundo]|uniref:Uncharacterized protein n=1 Tax=Acer negundo TaxID=4023 RepID=A0AAD5JHG2_ACENE|nr:hypothetical protein LWI28_000116 [Acer negundo]
MIKLIEENVYKEDEEKEKERGREEETQSGPREVAKCQKMSHDIDEEDSVALQYRFGGQSIWKPLKWVEDESKLGHKRVVSQTSRGQPRSSECSVRLSNRHWKAPASSSPASHDPIPSFLPLFFFFFVDVWLVQPADSSSPTSGRCHPYLIAGARLSPLL